MSIIHHHYPGIKCWHSWTVIFVVVLLAVATGALQSISVKMGRIEQNFSIVQELQKEVKRLDKLTQCLEPAR